MEDKFKGIQTQDVRFDNYQELNEQFSTVSVKLLYSGKNGNGTFYSREVVERNIASLANMPVVGEFSEELNDFKGHGGKMVVTDEAIKFVNTTRPYGVVPESFTHEWMNEDLGDGRTKETLVIHGVILWTKHYEEAWKVLQNQSSQSMEVEITKGRWDEETELYKVEDFRFHALAILGDQVRPCFENSHFYSMQSFKDEFAEMLNELKQYSLYEKEDKDLKDDKQAVIEEPVEPVVEPDEPVVEEPVIEEPAIEEPVVEDPVEPVVEEPAEPAVDVASYEAKIDELNAKLETYEKQISELSEFRNDVMRERHEADYAELLTKYHLSDSDVDVADVHQYSIEELDTQLRLVIADKAMQGKYSLNASAIERETNKVAVDMSERKTKSSRYGDLFEEFS